MSDSSSDDDFEEAFEVIDEKCLCLFCELNLISVNSALKHLGEEHDFNLVEICREQHFDMISYIMLINFIRKNKTKDKIKEIIQMKSFIDDKYMKPVVVDDPFLTYDIESEIVGTFESQSKEVEINSVETYSNDLQVQNKVLKEQVKSLQQIVNDMQVSFSSIVLQESTDVKLNTDQLTIEEDANYVNSYSHYSIHHEMLSDSVRTESYQKAIISNSNIFKHKIVLDVGCGTGILSIFAAQAGAKKVIAVDHSDIIRDAIDISSRNGFGEKIEFVMNRLENIDFEKLLLPTKYDIIISEWMGYFLLFEGMLDSILYARDHLLSGEGFLLPNKCNMYLAGMSDEQMHNKYVKFWQNVYGIDMSCFVNQVLAEATVDAVSGDTIATKTCLIQSLDLETITLNESQQFSSDFCLEALKDTSITAIVGWFDCHFSYPNFATNVTLSTSPFLKQTHWMQSIFLLKVPIQLKEAETLSGCITVSRNHKQVRSLIVKLAFENYGQQIFNLV